MTDNQKIRGLHKKLRNVERQFIKERAAWMRTLPGGERSLAEEMAALRAQRDTYESIARRAIDMVFKGREARKLLTELERAAKAAE